MHTSQINMADVIHGDLCLSDARTIKRKYSKSLGIGKTPQIVSFFSLDSQTFLARVYVYAGCTHLRYCLLYTSPSPRDRTRSRMPSSA